MGYTVFIKSLLKNNPWFDLPIILIDIDLTEEDKKKCRKYYDNIEFRKPKKEEYKYVNWRKTQRHLWNTYYTLDIFSYTEYDRVVFIDLDVIVLKNIYYLFSHNLKNNIGGVRAYVKAEDKLLNYINAGVIVVDMCKLPQFFYKNIVAYASQGFRFPEQDTINKYREGKIDFLPKIYNVEKRMLFSDTYPFDINDVAILHYVAIKPWQKARKKSHLRDKEEFCALDKLWWEWYNE